MSGREAGKEGEMEGEDESHEHEPDQVVIHDMVARSEFGAVFICSCVRPKADPS